MELYKEIFIRILEGTETSIACKLDLEKILEAKCYKALEEIVKIVRTPDYEDADCFRRIEKIICELEMLGSHADSRHDFG